MSITPPLIVFYSAKSGNTKRFVDKLGFESIQLDEKEPTNVDRPFILVTPTYGGGYVDKAVRPSVIRFLNNERNRSHLKGVIGTGNTNFGSAFAIAADIIAKKCHVPVLARVELLGTDDDVLNVTACINQLFDTL
jgi:protein involved in ribonucleotide reduction